MIPKHETKLCPRCSSSFECKSGSILLCQCQTVVLSAEQLEYINLQYEDCLCAKCLLAVRAEFNEQQHVAMLKKISGR
ncbi:MAG: cysteine-rich CWC family protein [Thioalkalispiraceae bacterium]|jgi:hypothetical protein